MELNLSAISNKTFKFSMSDLVNSTDVEVTTPNLENLKFTVWGDWGPMYTFDLTSEEQVEIKYNGDSFFSSQKKLSVDSPMLAKERDEFPFVITVEDDIKELKFKLYIDKKNEFSKVEVSEIVSGTKLYRMSEERSLTASLQ